MSEKRLDNFELEDDKLENVAGGADNGGLNIESGENARCVAIRKGNICGSRLKTDGSGSGVDYYKCTYCDQKYVRTWVGDIWSFRD